MAEPRGNTKARDNQHTYFGTGNDVDVYWDATNLLYVPAATNTVVKFGTSTLGIDTHLVGEIGTRKMGGLVYAATAASTAVTNTTTETVFDTNFTFPANTLTAGTLIRCRGQAIATATVNSDTWTVRLRIGGVAGSLIFNSGATDATNSDLVVWDMDILIRTAGSSGTLVAYGSGSAVGASGTATMRGRLLASTTINTQTTQQLTATCEWSVAEAAETARCDGFTVEVIRG